MKNYQKLNESTYNHYVDIDGELILFNTFSGNMVCLPQDSSNLKDIVVEHHIQLARLGFLVDTTPEEESASVIKALITANQRMYLIFTITTTCNLKCSYCFENREKRSVMSIDTLERSLQWVERQFEEGRFTELSVIIFGGEPLLVPNQLKRVLNGLRKISTKYTVGENPILLTTNALSGDSTFFEQLHTLGVTQIQVTFDGDASITNARRKNSEINDVYHMTLNRLPMLAEFSALTVKLNFAPDTIDFIPGLMDDLSQTSKLMKNGFQIKPEPIVRYQSNGEKTENSKEEFGSNDERLANSFAKICELAEERNLSIDRSAIFNTPCMAFRKSSYLLEPNGKLRSCISAFGMDTFSVGDVFSGSDHSIQSMALSNRVNELDSCVEDGCTFLPMCGGGCPYERELETGKFEGLQCRRDYFNAVLPVFIGNAWRTSSHKLYLLS